MSTIEIYTDWKLLQIYNPDIFMELKSPLNWLKSRITKIKDILNENVKQSKVKYIPISCKKWLILDVSIIKSSVLGGNVSWDREVSAIKCLLHRGFVMRV